MKIMQSSGLLSILFVMVLLLTIPTEGSAKWWDKFGEPVYGREITVAMGGITGFSFDTYNFFGGENCLWYESLFEPSWTVDRETWSMTGMFYPDQYWQGNLAESWEITDPTTITAHLRQGVHWQDKAPVNGREFIASDVEFHYDRMLGTGSGYTQGNPMYLGMAGNLAKVTAADKYTVVFKFKQPSAQNFQTISDRFAINQMDAPEWVALGGPPSAQAPAMPPGPPKGAPAGAKKGPPAPPVSKQGPLSDWKTVIGTGAWMFTEYVEGSKMAFSKNPDYWGTDERHPGNKLPYADNLTLLIIEDPSTRLAALRTGKIDTMNNSTRGISWRDAQRLGKTNPDIQMEKMPAGASGVGIRVDKEPFDDIRVRIALDMAIDREAIAKSYYGGLSSSKPVGFVTADYKGYAYNYDDWPQPLKDQYAYNPEGAKKLLAEAGYPQGFKTNVVSQSNPEYTQLLEIFKSYFNEIGLEMEIRVMDTVTYSSVTRDQKHDQLSSQGLAFNTPPTRLIDYFYSKTVSDCVFYGLNNVPDTVYDNLHDQFLAAEDPEESRQILQQMDKRVIEQHYTVAAPETYNYTVWQPWLKGYNGEVLMWGQGVAYARFWIKK